MMNSSENILEFFEKCAEEAKMDANKSMIMRNAIHARRSLRRSKTRFRGSLRRKIPTTVAPEQTVNADDSTPKIDPNPLVHL